jgi:hypothetical protein
MNDVKVVCFHTPNGIYPEMAQRLKQSCEHNHILVEVDQRNDLGSWVKNCAQKANYILEKVKQTNINSCVVWLDSDSRVVKYPELFLNIKEDFAIRAKPGPKTIKPVGRETIHLPKKWTGEPAWFESGTIFFRHTNTIIDMLELWIKLGEHNNRWDQWTLQEAWAEVQPPTLWLPRSYCQIHKLHGDKDAVILHDLASVIQKVNRL